MDELLAWPDVLLHLGLGIVATAVMLLPAMWTDRTAFARARAVAKEQRELHGPPSTARRVAAPFVMAPLIALLLLALAVMGWYLREVGWLSAPLVVLIAIGLAYGMTRLRARADRRRSRRAGRYGAADGDTGTTSVRGRDGGGDAGRARRRHRSRPGPARGRGADRHR